MGKLTDGIVQSILFLRNFFRNGKAFQQVLRRVCHSFTCVTLLLLLLMLRSITLCTRCSPKKEKGKRTKNNESQIHGMLEAAITDGNKGLRIPTLVLGHDTTEI